MMLNNKVICPETVLGVQLPAAEIPDSARVRKRTGEQEYVLKHNLTLWQNQTSDAKPVVVEGYFLVGARGDIGQIAPGKTLVWLVAAEDLIDLLQRSWEPTPQ